MKRNNFKKCLFSCLLISITIVSFTACTVKDKETVISKDVSQDIKAEEKELRKAIDLGNDYLQQGKYDEARKSYEKAISMDKGNKYIYLEIKDKYMEKERFDDGFYIIKLAIDNKVDYANMKNVLEEIKKKFQIVDMKESIYRGDEYVLPKNVTIKVNEKNIDAPVKWNNTSVDTSKIGTFTFEGEAEEYGRIVKITLNVSEAKIGYVTQVYEENGNKHLKFDEVQFLGGEKGIEERRKDAERKGLTVSEESLKTDDGWFIKDDDEEITTYKISNNASFNLHDYVIDPLGDTQLKSVSYEVFKKAMIAKNSECPDKHSRNALCRIYLENGTIVKIESQYIP